VFYDGHVIEDASSSSFEVLGRGYARNTYYYGQKAD
jgi:hypothetical protein